MALTAREWIILSKEEQEKRKNELSPQENFRLRTDLELIRFSEEEKKQMSEEQKYDFVHSEDSTSEEKEKFSKKCEEIFKQLIKDSNERTT